MILKATVPSSDAALPPSVEAASKDVPLTVKTLTDSLHFTVLRAFPVKFEYRHEIFKERNISANSAQPDYVAKTKQCESDICVISSIYCKLSTELRPNQECMRR